jgi:hypothetical protein
MCNLSLGVWETLCTHFVPFSFKKNKNKKKKNFMHVHVCLKILVDFKNCDLILIGELKIFEHMI